MALKRNFSVGLFGSIWSALLGLAVIPLYIKYLGAEAYGLIGFFATTQALLQLLDLGLSPTINREVARCSATNKMQEARSLLHTLSIVYWGMAFVIGLIIIVLAPLISNHWLQARALPTTTITQALMLMGLVVACRWPVGLYMGALMGMQRVALSSIINTAFGTLSSLGTVAVLILISPTIKAFFIWQACVGVCYALVMHVIAWHVVQGKHEKRQFSFDDLKRVWKFSAGMSAVTVTGIILIQADKLLLSKLLSLGDFGHYTLAALVANSLYILLTPLFNTIYPKMSALVASNDTEKLVDLYKNGTRLFLGALFPIAIVTAVFSENLLYLWTGNQELAIKSSPIVSLFLIGTALNGVMHFPYALQLAYGETKLPIRINLILIIITVPMTIVLGQTYGAVGGAGSWAILNFIYLLIGTWLTHRTLLKGVSLSWLLGDVILPLCVATFAGLVAFVIKNYSLPIYVQLLACIMLVIIAFIITICISPKLRLLSKGIFERKVSVLSNS
ncbi:MAG: polysaccharide biosynthesis protein [Methylotenera sp.]|nr:MAG: polysaccharide biosynthesis protein [Methylotenera sp.]